ncbi:MAG: hypothetical protein ACLGIN_08015 [Candidatus Sericytochromatia bacterium]
MRKRAILALALAGALLGCGPEREGGGGGLGPSKQPTTVTMVPRMISGQGMVTYRPVGDEVEVRVRAENLPEPYTYQFRLIGPGTRRGTHGPTLELERAKVDQGRIDQTIRMSQLDLMRYRGLELVHLPSGTALDERKAHPALVASFPTAMRPNETR